MPRPVFQPPVWVVLALPDEPDMAFELLMLPESLLPLRQPDSSSAAATAQLRRAFLSLCHKRYAPFHLFGSSIARQESIYLCIFLLETVLYLSCGLPRPVLWEGRCCPMAYISTFILSVAANVASYYICKWLDGC